MFHKIMQFFELLDYYKILKKILDIMRLLVSFTAPAEICWSTITALRSLLMYSCTQS